MPTLFPYTTLFRSRRARVRTRHPHALERAGADHAEDGEARAVRSFTGELISASEEEVTLAADGGVIAIPYTEIRRSNLIEE